MEKLVIKYLTEDLNQEDLESLKTWLKEDVNKDKFRAYLKANRELDFIYREWDEEKAYEHILQKIEKEKPGKVRKLYTPLIKYAAVFLLLVISGYFIYDNLQLTNSSEFVSHPEVILNMDGEEKILNEHEVTTLIGKDSARVAQTNNFISYKGSDTVNKQFSYHSLTVPYGKRFQIELSDGSLVFLNAGTTLRYPTSFSSVSKREIELDGEAFIQVVENKAIPFIVRTEDMNVRVLGTKFNVTSYKNEDNTSAVLVEGSVAVYRAHESFDENSLRIVPGEKAVLRENNLEVKTTNIVKQIAWTEGKLYFVNDRFKNIMLEMQRHYNIEIQNNYEALNNFHFTGTFEETETLPEVLEVFKEHTDFQYHWENNRIIIEPK